jgi:hypothetical protein
MKSCANCEGHYTHDYGYSNYTVEGTTIGCKTDKNPGYPAEDPHYQEKESAPHTYAEECPSYFEGEGESFDVEDACPYPAPS